MFMKFWIYMSFCVLNLTKGGDIFKNYFWRAKIQNGRQLVRHLGFGTSKKYFLRWHHPELDKACNKLYMYQISQTNHENSRPLFHIDKFRFCPRSSSRRDTWALELWLPMFWNLSSWSRILMQYIEAKSVFFHTEIN